jgi:hypothetical protein
MMENFAQYFYKDNTDHRFTYAPTNKKGPIIGGFQSYYFLHLIYDQFYMMEGNFIEGYPILEATLDDFNEFHEDEENGFCQHFP